MHGRLWTSSSTQVIETNLGVGNSDGAWTRSKRVCKEAAFRLCTRRGMRISCPKFGWLKEKRLWWRQPLYLNNIHWCQICHWKKSRRLLQQQWWKVYNILGSTQRLKWHSYRNNRSLTQLKWLFSTITAGCCRRDLSLVVHGSLWCWWKSDLERAYKHWRQDISISYRKGKKYCRK